MTQLCQNLNSKPWFSIPFDAKADRPTDYGDVLWCDECQMGFLATLPRPDEIPAHYVLPNYYTHGDRKRSDRQGTLGEKIVRRLAWQFDAAPRVLHEELADLLLDDASVLDIGCGSGFLLKKFRNGRRRLVGVEPDAQARGHAAKDGIEAYDGSAENLPAELASDHFDFDFVCMTHVLEHCLDPLAALKNAISMTKPSGAFYCEVPNAGSTYFQRYAAISEQLDVPRHLYFFSEKSLIALADAAGIEITRWRFEGYTRHYSWDWTDVENGIYDMYRRRGLVAPCPRRHVPASLAMLLSTVAARPSRKYDSIGFFGRPKSHIGS